MHPRVASLLQHAAVPFRAIRHLEFSAPILNASDFAQALGYEAGRITKTLLLKASGKERFCLAVVSANARVNFSIVGRELGGGRYSVASPDHLARLLDYPPFGVSPLGAPDIPVLIDGSLECYETVLIGSGVAGIEIELAPSDLKVLTLGRTAELT